MVSPTGGRIRVTNVPPESAAEQVIQNISAELRLGVWRRVTRGVAHDLLNVVMPLRSLGLPPSENGRDQDDRRRLAADTTARVTALGVALHRLEASDRESDDRQDAPWPLLRELIRWAVPRGVRVAHDESGVNLGDLLTPASAALVFWTAALCGELVPAGSGEIAVEPAAADTVRLLLPTALPPEDLSGVRGEAWAALQELARAGRVEIGSEPDDARAGIVSVAVEYKDGAGQVA